MRNSYSQGLYDQIHAKARTMDAGGLNRFLGGLVENAKLLGAMMRDRDFRIDGASRVKIIAGLLYFVMPLDIIPDFILGVGYLDDAVVIGMVLKTLGGVIEQYRAFRVGRGGGSTVFDGQVKDVN